MHNFVTFIRDKLLQQIKSNFCLFYSFHFILLFGRDNNCQVNCKCLDYYYYFQFFFVVVVVIRELHGVKMIVE